MRLAMSLRTLSLGVATASFLLAGAASAATATSPAHTWDMVGVNARLTQKIDTQHARPGETVEAKLDGSVRTAGIDLPRNTLLYGRVDHVEASQNGGPAALSLYFNQAELQNGQKIPVKVTVLSAFPAREGAMATYGTGIMGPAPKHVNSKRRTDQEPGLLSHISMHSAVQSHNSATFRKNDGDITLRAGTRFQLGIAPRNQNMTRAGA